MEKVMRCAIYTRKSCEDGLEQEFNSLDAQRLSAENYIASQIHENWRLISKHYDDGGYSGGNMNRPALKELFEDIKAGQIDMVVVYKIDRLSRSLFDFSKIVELFEKHNVGFVSVTQAFNTSTSSGKLMLNMLLSFAQYERELTSERIRDKFAAAKKLGLWMGGYAPLGYDIQKRQLVINPGEAEIVKLIFELFQVTESCTMVADELNRRGYRTKSRNHAGKNVGGRLFVANDVRRVLKDPHYKGYVTHFNRTYKGIHEAIIDEATWERVQTLFTECGMRKGYGSATPSFLKGILKCEKCGCAMTPTYTYNHGLRYRYYTCSNHIRHKTCQAKIKTYPAEELEKKIVEEIVKILKTPEIALQLSQVAAENNDPNVTNATIISAINDLSEIWEYLYPAEQHKIARLLIDEATVSSDGIMVRMNTEGVEKLSE